MTDSMAKSVGGLIPGMMALGVMGQSLKMVPGFSYGKEKSFIPKKGNGHMKMTRPRQASPLKMSKNLVKGGIGIMIGTSFIEPTAAMINKL